MKNKAYRVLFMVIALGFILPQFSLAQSDKKLIREGNKEFNKGNYNEAEINYRKALDKNPTKHNAQFNLGDALYEQEDYEKAAEVFAGSNMATISDFHKSNTAYNLGNSFLKAGKLNESIAAYKQALKFNPENHEARYNLEYAKQKQQQKQQEQNQDQNKDQQDQQDQNKDQNQDQKQDQQDQQDQKEQQQQDQQQQQNQQQNPGEQQGQQNEQQAQKISKKDAERMLEALKNNEKKTLEKLKKEKKDNTKVIKSDKDW